MILYGFTDAVQPEDVQAALTGTSLPIKIQIHGISIFNNPKFDVVKLDIESPQLEEMRMKVEGLPNKITFRDYKPHMTIAYVLRGRGNKYVHTFKKPLEFESTDIIFSDVDRNQYSIDISSQAIELNEGIITKQQLMEFGKGNIMSLHDLPFRSAIEKNGGKIYSVGGAVRDEFLGKNSKDLDILITGIPLDNIEQLIRPFGKVDAVGKSFGILKFISRGSTGDIDIAIPRTEHATGEGGHKGFDVQSDHNLPIEADLKRRDFTINAIAKDIDGKLIDPYGGIQDLKDKVIKVVNPEAFSDDPLRMLRAVQFASRFDFMIDSQTMRMIQQNASRIREISSERVLGELEKIVGKGDVLYGANLLRESGLYKVLFGTDSPKGGEDHWDL